MTNGANANAFAAPRDRPVRHGQPVSVQDLLGGDEVLARHVLAALALGPDLGRDLGTEERAHSLGKCQVIFAQGNVHVRSPPSTLST